MITGNEKAGRGGNPNQLGNTVYTKRISRDRREINGKRDYASEKYRRLKMTAGQRFNELARLVTYRRQHGLDIGPVTGWALVLSNLTECLGSTADCYSVDKIRRRLRLPAINLDIIAACCYPAEGRLMPQATVGDLLEVTSCERKDCRLLRIEACDESQADRKRRLARERQQRRRRVTRTIEKKNSERDIRRRTASPALRALTSSSSIRLPLRQEPQRSFFPAGGKIVRDAPRQASEITDRAYAPQVHIAVSHSPVCQRNDQSPPSPEFDARPPTKRRSRTND